jgi:hypothetical protein
MDLEQKSYVESRRTFVKRSLYVAPVLLALGHLSPSYSADASGLVKTTVEGTATVAGIAASTGTNPAPGAGTPSGNTVSSQVTGAGDTGVGGGGSAAGTPNAAAASDLNQTAK